LDVNLSRAELACS